LYIIFVAATAGEGSRSEKEEEYVYIGEVKKKEQASRTKSKSQPRNFCSTNYSVRCGRAINIIWELSCYSPNRFHSPRLFELSTPSPPVPCHLQPCILL